MSSKKTCINEGKKSFFQSIYPKKANVLFLMFFETKSISVAAIFWFPNVKKKTKTFYFDLMTFNVCSMLF